MACPKSSLGETSDQPDPGNEIFSVLVSFVPRVPIKRGVHIFALVLKAGSKIDNDRKRGVIIMGSVADPPTLGAGAATLGDEIHRIHQMHQHFQIVASPGVLVTAGLPQAEVCEMACVSRLIAGEDDFSLGQIEIVKSRKPLQPANMGDICLKIKVAELSDQLIQGLSIRYLLRSSSVRASRYLSAEAIR
jgi:hypothetical protein